VSADARLLGQFNDLLDHISNGWEIPDEFYRLDIGKNRDRLLEDTGIKHLHLNGRGSDIVVYMIELEDRVILLRISGHAYLEDEPRGSGILGALGLPANWRFGSSRS
jgi:hypothetical protein